MDNWNVVITAQDKGFQRACQLLSTLAPVQATHYFNVLTAAADDPLAFLERAEAIPGIEDWVARIVPVTVTFGFQSPEAFEAEAVQAITPWVERLAGRRFHVRLHRRGFRGRIVSPVEERFLDHFILERLAARGQTAQVDFADPDFILAVETLDQRGGASLWSREERARHRLLKLN